MQTAVVGEINGSDLAESKKNTLNSNVQSTNTKVLSTSSTYSTGFPDANADGAMDEDDSQPNNANVQRRLLDTFFGGRAH